jgi:energy-coupling factor transport system substrate-specific component
LDSFGKLVRYEFIAVLIACSVSLLLTWWVCLLLGLVPPQAYAGVVLANTLIPSAIGGPFVLKILQPRIAKWGLLWTEIMKPEEVSAGVSPKLGLIFLAVGALGGIAVLFWLLFASGVEAGHPLVRFLPMVFIALVFVGGAMLGGRNQVEAMLDDDAAVAVTTGRARPA